MVYASKVKGRKLTFQVSGMLWNRSLVMRDLETGSLWSHILGECMDGELKGTQLEILPAVMTTWKDWRKRHPQTTVLALRRTAKAYERSFYRDPARFVFGTVVDGHAKAYPFDALTRRPVVDDVIAESPVLVVFDSESTSAVLYSREISGADEKTRVLSFAVEGDRLRDRETKSEWDRTTGRATSGRLRGAQLRMLPALVSYRRAWKRFHPSSEYFAADDESSGGGSDAAPKEKPERSERSTDAAPDRR